VQHQPVIRIVSRAFNVRIAQRKKGFEPMTRSCLLLVFFLSLVARTTEAVTLKTADGLSLDLTANGRVTNLRIGQTALPLKGEGGFSIADFKNQPEPVNLVPNVGFEEGDKGWRLAKGQTLDTTIAHSGKTCARLEVPGPEPGGSNLEVFVPVKPNTRYRVGMWLRREKCGVCGAYSSERDDQNKLTGKQTQTGPSIPKEDGVWLPLSWEITTEPKTTKLSLRGDIYRSTGTIWLDDFFVCEVGEGYYEPVTGKITGAGSKLAFKGSLPKAGLELEATLMGDKECLRVNGVVRDTTGEDRAIGVKFALPLDIEGWRWFNDGEERETITPGPVHRYTYNCVSGLGRCSIYPWSAISGTTAGLSFALPLSQGPRVFLLQHDPKAPETSVILFFGLAKDAGNNPSRAPFSFVIYSHDPAWGMRSAMQKYYRLFPESFVKRPTYEGYLNYANLEWFDPKTHRLVAANKPVEDASDFGEGYKFLWHLHGCYDYRQVAYDDPKLPSDETVFSLMQKMVEAEKTKPKWYTPSEESIKKIVFGPNGQISYIGDTHYWRPHEGYNHTDQPGWGFNFRVNEDPEVSPFLASLAKSKAEEYAKTPHRPWDATFTADAIEGYMANTSMANYRREHFKTTLVPLTFGYQNLKPAMANTIWDFHQKCWKPVTDEHNIVTYGNANGYEQFFTMPYVDIPMTEGNWDPQHDGRLDRFMRAINYRKIWRYWHAWDKGGGYGDKEPANVMGHFRRGLAYAIYPAVYCIEGATGDLETYRAQFRQYVPAIEELSVAGWDPVPYATATEGVVVERFGAFANGELHFTLRNYEEKPVETTLSLHRKDLGIPGNAELVAMDILPRTPQLVAFPKDGEKLTIEADGTKALWVGTREQAAQHGFRLAAATLEKLERFYYPEMNDSSKATWQQALSVAKAGTRAKGNQALTLAEQLQQSASAIEETMTTNSPVDLAKLLYRMRVEASFAPVALLGLDSDFQRIFTNGLRGATTEGVQTVSCSGQASLSDLKVQVVTPWSEVAVKCDAKASAASLERGQSLKLDSRLYISPSPPRRLMCYLVELKGKANGAPFTVALPVDLQVGSPLAVKAIPERVFRGKDRKLSLTITNRLAEPAKVTMKLTTLAKVTITPSEFPLDLPANGKAEQVVTLVLEKNVGIGELRINYAFNSKDPRLITAGCFDLLVSDPVPQVAIKRTATPPTIDGKLTESVWQDTLLIPELRLLANGGAATEKSTVWTTYDDKAFYVAFRCADSQMSKVVAKYTERGSPLYLDDDVELFIFPPGAAQVYQFAINSLGTFSDNFGNKTDWRAAAQRTDKEWTVEVAIPYSAIGLTGPPPSGIAWGMQFGRQQKSKGETTSWTPGAAFISKEGLGEVVFE